GTVAIAPAQIMNLRAFNFDEIGFRRDGDGVAEPLRCGWRCAFELRKRAFGRRGQLFEFLTLLLRHFGEAFARIGKNGLWHQRGSGRAPTVLNTPVPDMMVRSPDQMRP